MNSEKLACETIRWLVSQITTDCLEVVAEPPPGFVSIPIRDQIRLLRFLAVSKIPWTGSEVNSAIELIRQIKTVVTNHRPLISSYSKVTVQHQQKSERVLEQFHFTQALDIVTGWEITQPVRNGYIELGFASEQVSREALLVIFSTPRYHMAVKSRISQLNKLGNYTSPF